MNVDLIPLVALAFASLCAGFIDSVVGGGGLVQLPALFSILPKELPATLFGTNKIASIFGTANAAWRFTRKIRLPLRTIIPATLAAFVFAYLGAKSVAWLPREMLRPMILVLLIGSAVYTFFRKSFGSEHKPLLSGRKEILAALAIGASIGFYDGFFGPGAGSFLIFLFIRFFGFDFLHASAASKIVNTVTNLAAISFFLPNGYFLPMAAFVMATSNVMGSFIGTHMALRYGSGFVRKFFILVVCALIVKFAWDTL